MLSRKIAIQEALHADLTLEELEGKALTYPAILAAYLATLR